LSTDMWSLGVTLYLLMFRDFPYVPAVKSGPSMKEAIRRGDPPKFANKHKTDKGLSDPATNLIKTLLDRDAGSRLRACEALEHPFITSIPDKSCHQEKAPALNAHTGTISIPSEALKAYDEPTSLDEESTDVPSHPSSDRDEQTTVIAL